MRLLAPARAHAAGTERDRLLVIAHRGASGYRPEHTLAAYELAARQGADYLEPDLVATADGVLVARHENEISGTTDVASRPEFAERRTTKVVDGRSCTGWFTEDFTLEELGTLRAVERIPALRQESRTFDGLDEVPTFAEVLELRERLSHELGREIGVYPETKHPSYFRSIGIPLEEPLVRDLREARLDRPGSPVFVQSFEVENLRALDQSGLGVPLVQLLGGGGGPVDRTDLTYDAMATPEGLRAVAEYADGVGPDKGRVLTWTGDQPQATSFVVDAHAVGLLVHPYTFRAENAFLPAGLRTGAAPSDRGRAVDEVRAAEQAGVDGVFTDQPDVAVAARALGGQAG